MKKKNVICFISILLNIFFIFYGIYAINKKNRVQIIQRENANRNIIQSKYYLAKESQFETLNIKSSDIVFLGDSITNRCEWEEVFNNSSIKNRGIDGDTTDGILNRLNTITKGHPKKIFLMIGINDLLHRRDTVYILNNYKQILNEIRMNSSDTTIYIESILPNNNIRSNKDVKLLNSELQKLSGNRIVYINLFDKFVSDNRLSTKYTYDGTHLNGRGYLIWKQEIEKYINP
ncbi:MAG: GDSL-type esterase/lipase family protein [Clostridium tyrobutyricum]|uniref:GDSL-type esterase/lipase family protein n=1 Tax=Clostridium tyrobutyricum TaxID=1519 RepID=UPI00242AE904|nr:GDSL-type esterase/lipase family protein [Clostridium tyrobutyricum]MCH4198500.1 GDSL-type esterase/lipase family protein [Clostridium tyrobutyricum]MCH4259031.1 GDSL-type esterase/lipase family protein [Clostridium tyrobutyricum]MCI1239883.1 GDSL-type esterase/lipase family protein [Clostridium tyrobutyricum]MCI1652948.1 GDSL-type esterase/lipase family protein [Clostridium tyrobutyricum]MCI1938215.1 GDSL-type esterase/lipase family protein [Clostridium tyrobutyricum]